MRRFVTLGALLLSSPVVADEAPRWTLQVDPLTTALGFVHLQVERALAPHVSVYAGPHARLFSSPLAEEDEDYLGAGVEAGVRVCLRRSSPEGWWAQVRGVGARLWTPGDETVFGGYVSALAGYTAIFGGGFVLSGGLGVQYLHYRVARLGPEGVLPAAHTTLGVAFRVAHGAGWALRARAAPRARGRRRPRAPGTGRRRSAVRPSTGRARRRASPEPREVDALPAVVRTITSIRANVPRRSGGWDDDT